MAKDSERGHYKSPEGSRTWEYLSAVFCAIGMFCGGTMMGWNSPTLNEFRSPDSRIQITPEQASTLTATLSIGHVIALPLSVFTVDRLGRKKSILFTTLPLILSWGMIILAENVVVLILARIMAGISFGMIISTFPVYTAEILSTKIRGSLGAISGATSSLGVLFMFGVAPLLGVRITAGCCMAYVMIFLISFCFIPESPYFLVMVGRVEEAESTLEKLRGKTDVTDELELIKSTIREKGKSLVKTDEFENGDEKKEQSAFKQLFTIRGNLKSFFIGMVLSTLQHFCGYLMILYYCHIILTDMATGFDVYLASIMFNILQLLSQGVTALVVDRYGRRPLLFTSGIISSILLSVIATYFYLMDHTTVDVRQYSIIPLGSIFALVMALNIGVLSVPMTIMGEIFAPDVKMLATCIIGLCGAAMTISISKVYLLIVKSWGLGHSVPFFSFAGITLLCMVILMRWLPETKGKTLLQIQKELNA